MTIRPVKKPIQVYGNIAFNHDDIEIEIDGSDKLTIDLFSILRTLEVMDETQDTTDKEEFKEELEKIKGILIQYSQAYCEKMLNDTAGLN